MNGLDAILNRIISDAEERILEIQDQSRQRRAEILDAADQEAEQLLAAARQRAAEESAVLERRTQSNAALESRKCILSARQALIDEVIAEAEASLSQLPVQERSELYTRLLVEHASGDETVVFPKDEQAFGAGVVTAVNRDRNWSLALADEPGSFRTGMILRRDLIETNLTSELLVRSMRPELVSLAARVLFGS